jgi:transcriptional regulator with XRE-family HTH domain
MTATTPFGQQLRHWRSVRSLSQLELALRAEVSVRHLSFMETGRSRPTDEMVLRLAEALSLPLRERNALLRVAGFAPRYRETHLTAPELAPARSIVDRMLAKHEPYPAFALDRYWDIVAANGTAQHLFRVLSATSHNAIEVFLGEGPVRQLLDNWSELAWATVSRLRNELGTGGADERQLLLLRRAEALVKGVSPPNDAALTSAVLCTRLRVGERVLNLTGTVASFSTPRDLTLEELRIELIFPADADAERFFEELAQAGRRA